MNTPTLGEKVVAYIRLARPANIITAISDILAGVAVSGIFTAQENYFPISLSSKISWLILSTTCLYAGGIIFNDVFDAELDKKERPERPIPRGLATVTTASIFGIVLLLLGIYAAYQNSILSASIAFAVALLALGYNAFFKHTLLAPLNMGMCRAGNLFLGMSIIAEKLTSFWFLGFAPLVFISAVTLVSKKEVHGATKRNLFPALALFNVVILALISYALLPVFNLTNAFAFIILFSGCTLVPLVNATKEPSAEKIRIAVQYGVLSIILMNASLAAGFAGVEYGILISALLPVSVFLSRIFAIT
mgnify:CR=1 FL=1